jgi:alkylation response protein AidB-like acyl-CoA dehydrogenase
VNAPRSAQALVDAAQALREPIEAGAAQRDREREFPLEAMGWVRDAGITAARVPLEYGGAGASFRDLARIMIALSQADPNLAQSLQPHFALQEALRIVASPATQARYFQQMADGTIITNALAERGGKFIGDIATQAVRENGGYRLTGTKYYCTGSFVADAFWVLSGAASAERLLAIVPADRAGVTIEDDWDAMGQRTTASGTVTLDNVWVADDEVMQAAHLWSTRNYVGAAAQLGHAAIDAGIAAAAFREALGYARHHGRPLPESGVTRLADDPYVSATIGDMSVQSVTATAVVLATADVLEEAANAQLQTRDMNAQLELALAQASIAVAEAKIVSSRAALCNCEQLFQVGGASMTARKLNFDRHWRNARTHTVHDPLSYKFKAIGDFYLNDRYPVIGTKI